MTLIKIRENVFVLSGKNQRMEWSLFITLISYLKQRFEAERIEDCFGCQSAWAFTAPKDKLMSEIEAFNQQLLELAA